MTTERERTIRIILCCLLFVAVMVIVKHEIDTDWGQHPSADLLDWLKP